MELLTPQPFCINNSRTVDPGPEMMAYPGNLNLQATMQYRGRVNASPLAVQLHRRFDYLLGHILFLEKEFGLIKGLLPDGLLPDGPYGGRWVLVGWEEVWMNIS